MHLCFTLEKLLQRLGIADGDGIANDEYPGD